jgi:hypothetical protein
MNRNAEEFFASELAVLGFTTPGDSLFQVVKELTDNAVDACSHLEDDTARVITVRVERKVLDPTGLAHLKAFPNHPNLGCYVVNVRDTGRGIPAEALPNLLGCFFQSTKGSEHSMGTFGVATKALILCSKEGQPVSSGTLEVITTTATSETVTKTALTILNGEPKVLETVSFPKSIEFEGTSMSIDILGDFQVALPLLKKYFDAVFTMQRHSVTFTGPEDVHWTSPPKDVSIVARIAQQQDLESLDFLAVAESAAIKVYAAVDRRHPDDHGTCEVYRYFNHMPVTPFSPQCDIMRQMRLRGTKNSLLGLGLKLVGAPQQHLLRDCATYKMESIVFDEQPPFKLVLYVDVTSTEVHFADLTKTALLLSNPKVAEQKTFEPLQLDNEEKTHQKYSTDEGKEDRKGSMPKETLQKELEKLVHKTLNLLKLQQAQLFPSKVEYAEFMNRTINFPRIAASIAAIFRNSKNAEFRTRMLLTCRIDPRALATLDEQEALISKHLLKCLQLQMDQ